jgi:tape measure domain-containing protein
LIGSFAAIQAAKFVFVNAAEIETQTRSLQVLTGSAEKAGQIVKELQQLGAVTPFTSSELIDSAKRLQAFGVEADKVVETTRRLADVSGATGAELQGLVTAYGQVQAKGRLQGEELLQFQERGVALQEELRKMYGLSGDEFQKALSKGRIGAEAVEVAITRLTNAGGKYANGAIAQSDTLAGKFSTLQDGIESLARDIGTKLAPALKNVLNLAIGAVNAIGNVLAGGFAKQAMQLRTALVLPGNTVDDLKKILALTQGISTQGLGASGIQQVANEIKTNQVAVANVLSNINASRPFGVTQQEQSLAEAMVLTCLVR